MASVSYEGATLTYPGNDVPSVDALDLDVADGEFLVLVGPSGSGKSTALRMLAGLEKVTAGRILIGERDVSRLSPQDRDVAMVFQSYALYPNMSVRQNMGFALANVKTPKAEIAQRVDEAARILHLDGLLDRKPKALSGGQRQRVAMGRAIVRRPAVFCMDEPLSNLDAKLRVSTRGEIADLQRRLGVTTVYVTHDQVEAMTMGHRVAVLSDGRLQQVATPAEIYENPTNLFVATFMGSPAMNLFTAPVRGGRVALAEGVELAVPAGAGEQVVAGIRSEEWEVVAAGTPGALDVDVEQVEALGAESFAYGQGRALADGVEVTAPRIVVRLDRKQSARPGETLAVRPVADDVRWFDPESGEALGHERGHAAAV
ncbi:sn-glycerol-3-phosphate ABC transporter ATP-binding protein UgpC [Brachybacterium huguangmaarense]|uniref:Sn-glycerol-3-phosphate ABC transporter ATP-binding protein UgpC n=1 Tax=Brachybacterium huguangmaarense TaxID=1652028 RepID=A0ABY6G3X2_9MICO|nr:sn-glycerol-3-phosphate ABC transporter ATP-binding protein UgpC [Brachybacterium huguangmaarense]UYG17344.1 sn-glycerol-3-phosphate ABC transporter ATP-binding protein UgpC [Brachybacterium huguangmaarense]